MDDYPDYDEEFEAMHAEELEAMREMEDIAQPPQDNVDDFIPITNTEDPIVNVLETIVEPTVANKRSLQSSLFGDIDDILSEDLNLPKPKRLKKDEGPNIDDQLALIKYICEERQTNRNMVVFGKAHTTKWVVQNIRDNISYRLPKYSYHTVRRFDGEVVYIRCHSEEFEKEERQRLAIDLSFKGVMGTQFESIWKESRDLLQAASSVDAILEAEEISQVQVRSDERSMLWVDLYKPKKYYELLSDEGMNRTLLQWLKLWDKIVFNRRPKIKPKPITPPTKKWQSKKFELDTELDDSGRPRFKVALLCGPPGLGKTTLAHMVAKHAGYKVVEINASDDRSVDVFRTALDNATQMTSVLDREKRPNCIIFDEIDGAPPASIEFLIKYINGTHCAKPKKGKQAKSGILKRPIICICNDAYVPALRSLRQIAFVLHVPPTSSARLSERLNEISRKEGIDAHMGALVALSEKSNNDIRSCLSVLHFFKSQGRKVSISDVMKASVGQKDMQKGLFSVWQDIFRIPRPKKGEPQAADSRWKKVLDTVTSFGDYDRVANGVFENYTSMNVRDSSLASTADALDWFCYHDVVSTKIQTLQNYSLSSYLHYGFVKWHYAFGSMQWAKISYPSVGAEVRVKTTKTKGLLGEVLKGMRPTVRAYSGPAAVKLDVLPLLTEIITPPLRPVNLHLYTQQEKDELARIVGAMIDYNLNYVQERNQEGSYIYSMDPNIDDIIKFSTSKPKRFLSYSNRQLIAREIEMEKMRRVETAKNLGPPLSKGTPKTAPVQGEKQSPDLPNHLRKLKAKTVKATSSASMNFFIISKPAGPKIDDTDTSSIPATNDIWFEYNEGHTNAVRKPSKISELL